VAGPVCYHSSERYVAEFFSIEYRKTKTSNHSGPVTKDRDNPVTNHSTKIHVVDMKRELTN